MTQIYRVLGISVVQCLLITATWSQENEAGLAQKYLLDASAFQKSLKSAHGKFTIKEVTKNEFEAQRKTMFSATVELFYSAPRYHLIADEVESGGNGFLAKKLKRQHIFYDGTELVSIEIDRSDQVSGVIEFWRDFNFDEVGFPLDDPLFLTSQFNAKLKESKKLTVKPLQSGGFVASRESQRTDNVAMQVKGAQLFQFVQTDLTETVDFYVGKYGPIRYSLDVKRDHSESTSVERSEFNFIWDDSGETPFIRKMSQVESTSRTISKQQYSSDRRVDVEYEHLEFNVPVDPDLLELKSCNIPVGTRLRHGGLYVGGKPAYRVFDGTKLVKEE